MIRKKSNQKSREQIRKERVINRSLVQTSKYIREKLGVVAVQPEKDVFVKCDGKFCKIYSFNATPIEKELKLKFLETIYQETTRHIRITSFCRNNNGKINAFSFLTVYFNAESYAEVISQIEEFEELLMLKVCQPLNIGVSRCSLENLLVFIHMNYTGKMRQIELEKILKRKISGNDMIPNTEIMDENLIKSDKLFFKCFWGKEIPTELQNVNSFISKQNVGIQIAVDIQKMTDEETQLYERELERLYNYKLKPTDKTFLNLTYLIEMSSEVKDELVKVESEMKQQFSNNKMLLLSSEGMEMEVFHSINSLGLAEFHATNMTTLEAVTDLWY